MAALVVGAVGCDGVGASAPWVPIGEVTGPLAPEVAAAPSGAPLPAGPVRVVTYNVDEENNTGAPAIAAALQGDPDLASASVFLFEEEEAYPEEPESRSARLAALLGVGYAYVPARVKGTGTHGLAIMSRYPITNVQKMDLPATNGQPRIAVSADITIGSHTLSVIDVHLETFIDTGERLAQLRPAVIDAGTPVLVGGDFNMGWLQWITTGVPVISSASASDEAPAVDSYMAALGFDAPAAAAGATAHALGQEARDDAFYTRGLSVRFGGVPRVGPSDHWPLWMDVVLP